MPTITGLVEDSGGKVIAKGRLTARLRQMMIDRSTTPDAVLTTLAHSWQITDGKINSPAEAGTTEGSIVLPTTEAQKISYAFSVERAITTTRWYLNDGTEYSDNAPRVQNGGIWYTGAVYVAGESKQITSTTESTYEAVIDPFDAIIPDVPTLEFVDLIDIAAEFVSQPQAGLVYLARMLTVTPEYADKLKIGKWAGVYTPGTTYFRGDIVSFGSPLQSWIWKVATPGSNQPPPATGTTGNTYWDYFPAVTIGADQGGGSGAYVLKAGDTMAGDLILPIPTGTTPAAAAMRKAEADTLYLPAGHDADYVKLTGDQTVTGVKTFGSSPILPTPTAGDSSTKGANTAYVSNEIRGLMAARLLVSAVVDSTPPALSGGVTNLIFESELYDPTNRYNPGTGDFVVPANGTYEFECRLLVKTQGSVSSAGDVRQILKLYLYNFTANGEVGLFQYLNLPMSATVQTYGLAGRVEGRDLTAGQVIIPRLSVATSGGGSLLSQVIDTAQGNAQNSFRAFRVTY